MFSFFISLIMKILEWSLVTAAVLVYIEIGPGGDSLKEIVEAIKNVLITIDWNGLINTVWTQLEILLKSI